MDGIQALLAVVLFNAAAMLLLLVGMATRGSFNGRGYFAVAVAAMKWWLVAAALELMAAQPEDKVFWAIAAWPGIATLPPAWVFFLHSFCFDRSGRPTWRRWAVLLSVPAVVSLLALTNPLHQAFYGPLTAPRTVGGGIIVDYDHRILFHFSIAVLYAFLAVAVGMLVVAVRRTKAQYRPFFRALLFATLIPMLGNVGYLVFDISLFGFDPTPILFSFALLLTGGEVLLSRLLSLGFIVRDVIFENAPDGIVYFDTQGRLAGANETAPALLRAPLVPVGAPLPATGPVWSMAREALETGQPPEPRIGWIGERAFDMRVVPIYHPMQRAPAVMGWILLMRDTTDLLQMSESLVRERDRLRMVMEHSAIGFFVIGASGQIEFANSEAARIVGRSRDEIFRMAFTDPDWRALTLDGAPMDEADLPAAQVLRTGEAVIGYRHALVLKTGQRKVLSVNAIPLRRAQGLQVVCSVTDVTAQERVAEVLRERKERAEAANLAKSQFLAVISHEIRTPLNGVLGMAELLDATALSDEQRRMTGTIRSSGRVLMDLLNDVLDFAHLDQGAVELDLREFSPADLAEEIDAQFAEDAEDKGLHWEVFVTGDSDRLRIGDRARLAQILRNLVSNAVKFTTEGHVSVTLSARRDKPFVLRVEDSGQGMDRARIAELLEPFAQADLSLTRRHGGPGLGLALVNGLVRRMGGTLTIDSAPGQGTTVCIELPLEEAASQAAR